MTKRRCAIYLFYDEQGIVDDYIIYYLQELKKVVDRIVVVCNGRITIDGRRKIEKITKDVFCRENIGYDAWAYKEALGYIGWENMHNYDELVITNFTIYGPFYPFEKFFAEMDLRACDFWGIHRRYEDLNEKTFFGKPTLHGYMPEFALSNFWVIRREMLLSYEFKKYWDTLPSINSYIEACIINEPKFTVDMQNAGFVMEIYSDGNQKNICPSPTTQNAYYQLAVEKLPVLRRRVFINSYMGYLQVGLGDDVDKIFEYIDKETDYDVNLILDNLIRTQNMYELRNRLHFNYIINEDDSNREKVSEKIRIAVVFHIFYADLVETCKKYIDNFDIDLYDVEVFITTMSEETKEEIGRTFEQSKFANWTVEVIPNKGRDIASVLVAANDFINNGNFDYVCFAHDKKMPHLKWKMAGDTFVDRCYRSIMGNSNVVNNVVSLFEANEKLGIVSCMPPYHNVYYPILGGTWTKNYPCTKKLADELGLKVNIDENKPPVAPYGTCFWFRPEALKILFERRFDYDDFPGEPLPAPDNTILHAIERIYSFVAQEAGYYSAYVITDKEARYEMTNLSYMLKKINDIVFSHTSLCDFNGVLNRINNSFKSSGQVKEVIKEVPTIKEVVKIQEVNPQEYLETVPYSMLLKKLIKRAVPKCIWNVFKNMRKKKNGIK